MHGLHDLTGNDDKSLKGESLVCFDFRNINTMKQRTLYCDLLLRGSPSLFSCILFGCSFFFFGMSSIITKTDVHSMTHTSPLIIYYHLHPLPDLKPSHSFIRISLILHSHICESKLALEVRLTLATLNLFRESFMKYNH